MSVMLPLSLVSVVLKTFLLSHAFSSVPLCVCAYAHVCVHAHVRMHACMCVCVCVCEYLVTKDVFVKFATHLALL